MQVRLLGPMSVRHQEAELALGGLKQRAVFALLALHANRVVSMDRLIEAVWPDEPPAQATVALRSYISRLRRLLADTPAAIETKPPGWVLRTDETQVDAVRFVRLVAEARRRVGSIPPDQSRALLDEALALWSGDPLADLAGLDFAQLEGVRLINLQVEADELLLEARLATGDQAGVIDEARSFVDAHPYRERAWCALMLALYRNGQQSDAVAAYARLRRTLRDDLGLDPSPQARDLEARILRQDPSLLVVTPAAPAATEPVSTAVVSDLGADEAEHPLVGRTEVMARLDASWRRAVAGSGQLMLIEAEVGAGKSAVLQALAVRVRASGGLVLEGNGVGDDASPALWPWVSIVQQLLAERPELAGSAALSGPARLAAATFGSGIEPAEPSDAPLGQTTLYHGVVDLLRAGRQTGPLLVMMDDLQWMDRDSLTLLALAVDRLAPAGVLFAAAVRRDAFEVDAVERLLRAVHRDRISRIELEPLSSFDVTALADRLAGRRVEPALVQAIADRTAGNPLFVTEMVRLLVAEGRLTEDAVRLALPAGVRDVLQRRIDRLPTATVELLRITALTGPNVLDVDLLTEVTGLTEDDVLDGCEAALLSGLLVEDRDSAGTLHLSHDLVRQTLTAGLLAGRRVRWHARIAAALQQRPGATPERIVEIARQLTLAAPAVGAAAALPYLIAAAEDALSRSANESAEAVLQTALATTRSIEDRAQRRPAELQIRGLLVGLQTLARATLPDLPDEDLELPQPTDARSAAGWIGMVTNAGNAGRYDWVLAEAQRVLRRSPSPSAEIAARFVVGWVNYVHGDLAASLVEFAVLDGMVERGVDIALPGALSYLAETVVGYSALIAHAQGDDDRAQALMNTARQRAAGSDGGLLNLALYDSLLAAWRGDRPAAAQHAATTARLSRVLDYPIYAVVTGVVAAWARGLAEEPGESIDQAYAAYAATGIRSHDAALLLLRAEVHAATGDPDGAVELVRRSQQVSAELGDVLVSPRLAALADRLLRGRTS